MIGIEIQIIEIDLSMDKTIEKGLHMVKIIGKTLGEETIHEHKIIEDKLLEGNIQETRGIIILIGVEVGQDVDSF